MVQKRERLTVLELTLISGMFGTFGTGVVHVGQNEHNGATLEKILTTQETTSKKLELFTTDTTARFTRADAELERHDEMLRRHDQLLREHDDMLKRRAQAGAAGPPKR
jgi:hypothetical protein